jgi:hypothetical protein
VGWYALCALTGIRYNLTFESFLTLWSSATGFPDGTGTPPPSASLAERSYAVLLQQPWSIASGFNVDAAGNGTQSGAASTTLNPNDALTFQPVAQLSDTGAVLIPPRAVDVTADNAKH